MLKITAGGVAAAGFAVPLHGARAQDASPEPAPPAVATPMVASQYAYVGADSRTAIANGADPETTGIAVFAVDPGTGTLTEVQSLPSDNAFFFAFHPTADFLYAVNVIGDYEGMESGSVEAYAVDPTSGALAFINRQPSGGAVAAHLSVDPGGRWLVVANYNGRNFVTLPIADDGSLGPVASEVVMEGSGPNAERQDMSHPHAVTYDPGGNFIAGADLGIDKVIIFRLDQESGALEQVSEVATAPGAGPRHVAFNAEGTLLYVVNELDATISVYGYDAETGAIGEHVQTISTVPDPFEGTKSTAEIFLHPNGAWLYNSNRGQPDSTTPEGDAIVAFAVDETTGELSLIGHMMDGIGVPWSFTFDAAGVWLYAANYDGDNITQYAIDPATGALSFTGLEVATPKPFVIVMRG